MTAPAPLTSTSHIVLGMLARGPRTAGELLRSMSSSGLRVLWPRTESKLYEEPKKLVAHGYARSEPKVVGGRQRTAYRVTAAGRRALRRWLAQPATGLVFECEAAAKVQLADLADRNTLLANIAATEAEAERRNEVGWAFLQDYLRTGPRFPERVHVTALTASLVREIDQAVARWRTWAEEWVRTWPDGPVVADETLQAEAMAILREVAKDVGIE